MGIILDGFLYLPENARPYYDAIRPMHDWNDFGLVHVVHLSKMLAIYETLMEEIQSEGMVINGRVNIKYKISESLYNIILKYTRMLKIDAFNYIGRARDNQKKNFAKYKILKTLKELKDEELIALPVINQD